MAMPVTVPRYTLQDLESFPDDGNRYELLDGVLLVTPAPAMVHQLVLSRLLGVLMPYLGPGQIAEVFTPGCVELEPNLHLEPDLLVVPAAEVSGGIGLETRWTSVRHWWLAVEISGASTIYDRDHKTPAYLQLGVREVWRVDLRERTVYISTPENREEVHVDLVTWLPPGTEVPLVISVPELFR